MQTGQHVNWFSSNIYCKHSCVIKSYLHNGVMLKLKNTKNMWFFKTGCTQNVLVLRMNECIKFSVLKKCGSKMYVYSKFEGIQNLMFL